MHVVVRRNRKWIWRLALGFALVAIGTPGAHAATTARVAVCDGDPGLCSAYVPVTAVTPVKTTPISICDGDPGLCSAYAPVTAVTPVKTVPVSVCDGDPGFCGAYAPAPETAPVAASQPRSSPVTAPSFNWGDAAVGIGIGAGLVLILVGAAIALGRRRGRLAGA